MKCLELEMMDKNYKDEERRIGFEIEYAGLPLDVVAEIVSQFFGGSIKKYNNTRYKVLDTDLGDFTLELDAIPLQKLAKSIEPYNKSDEQSDKILYQLGKTVGDLGAEITPYEIVCPPIAISQISSLQKFCDQLRGRGAKGTKGSFRYAFGLHINPEVTSLETDYILRHVQIFLLLASWLEEEHKINISRRMTGFIDPFPISYSKLILDSSYQPDMESLIRDYHAHNPTRNRALDMLPLFAFIKGELVRDLYGEEEKINKRPTFHYRLPNCEIGQKEWSLNTEWNRWLIVEKIAKNSDMLNSLMARWHVHQEKLLASKSGWVEEINSWMTEEYD